MSVNLHERGIVKFINTGGKAYFASITKKKYTISQAASITCELLNSTTPAAYNSIRRELYSSIRSGQITAVKDDTLKMWLITIHSFDKFLEENNYVKQLSCLEPV